MQQNVHFKERIPTEQSKRKTSSMFYIGNDDALPSEYIYDETYRNYKMKQKFQNDPKFSYFNAVMQMKRKLSSKQQVYKKVFESRQNQEQIQESQARKTFYLGNINPDNSMIGDLDSSQVVKIERLKRNSFKVMKQQPSMDIILDRSSKINHLIPANKTRAAPFRNGHKSNMSLYEKQSNGKISLQMITKARNNKSYVELQVTEKPFQSSNSRQVHTSFNPKPRLDQIMSQYRKMNSHPRKPVKKSSLPKQFIEKLYMTNKMFYSNINGKKRSAFH